MKINPVKYLPLVLLALTLAGAALPSRGKGKKTARELPAAETEQQRKADYIFMEAMRRNAVGEDDSSSNPSTALTASTPPTPP